ncbi:MAG: ketopantoate reductase family protein [Acidimicrobiales bacterium]
MRFIVYGAGAIGGVVGGRLAESGHEVSLLARGRHRATLAEHGLRIDSPAGSVTLHPEVREHPAEIDWRNDDVVLLAVKGQDTSAARDALVRSAPPSVAIVCLQNGVVNERVMLRSFESVYGVFVACPAGHMEPGVVIAYSAPTSAILDIGRYPSGTDATASAVAEAFRRSTIDSEVRADVMRWKYTKLLMNLGNVISALCGPEERGGPLNRRLREEAESCYQAAGIDYASAEEDRERRGQHLQLGKVNGAERLGDSSWQSLARGTGAIETEFLNGEIVLLGRLHRVPTPANELVCLLARQAVREGWPPGAITSKEILGRLGP